MIFELHSLLVLTAGGVVVVDTLLVFRGSWTSLLSLSEGQELDRCLHLLERDVELLIDLRLELVDLLVGALELFQ